MLDDLDLTADEHTCTALIGASGSGKSTLLRCINLLEVVDDGVIELDGEDITDPRVDANQVRTQIGIVFQAFNLFPHLRVLDNVTLAPRRVHGVSREQAEDEALAMLDRVGLREKARARPDELSGGQQQRVAIARALVDQAPADALRRGDERARPGARRRGARADPRAEGRRHDHAARDPRDGLRARRSPTRSASSTAAGCSSRARRSRCSAIRASRAPASSCAASSTPGGSDDHRAGVR